MAVTLTSSIGVLGTPEVCFARQSQGFPKCTDVWEYGENYLTYRTYAIAYKILSL